MTTQPLPRAMAVDPNLVEALERGAVLAVPTLRLQRRLRRAYDAAQAQSGRACWPAARVLAFDTWARDLWETGWPREAAAPEPLCEALWEEAVGEDARAEGATLLDAAATAREARQAYRLLHLYELALRPDASDEAEVLAFVRWRGRFEERLAEKGWVDAAALPGLAADGLASGSLEPPGELLLYGFDEMPPAHGRLVTAVESRGTRVTRLPFPGRRGCAVRVGAGTGREEVRLAARWVRGLLEGRAAGPERIGVVAPRLEEYAGWVEQVFTEELAPACLLPGRGCVEPPLDLSFGGPLGREPVVASALDLLGVGSGPVEWDLWSSLLRSPFWGGPGEDLRRAALDARLACARGTSWRAGELGHQARGAEVPGTAAALERLAALQEAAPGDRPPSGWAEHFAALLAAANWAGSRALSSREFQAREAFREALTRLRGFDALAHRVGRGWALARLRRLCAEPFRPEVAGPAVAVMGTLESSGLDFDYLWVLGVHAGAFPPEARANPFLPLDLQLRGGVRQASPGAQLRWARGVMARLLAGADRVVVSHPKEWGGAPVGPSPLVMELPEEEPTLAPAASYRSTLRRDPAILEATHDRTLPLETSECPRGGAALLADQAACPFRAFARHRLAARALGAPDQVLDALERGTGVHEALNCFWGLVPSLEEARGLPPSELDRALARAVEAGLDALERGRPGFSGRARELEGRRLAGLLREWLAVELGREPFRVIAREEPLDLELAGLRLRLRVDRVDEAEDGAHLLLDYKTGRPEPSRWFQDRPREPQLPLYALARPEARGIGYGVLRPGECSVQAVQEAGTGLEGPRSLPEGCGSWEELCLFWRERLEELAGEVAAGRAEVAPADDEACRYCDLPALCRIDGAVEEET